MQPKTKALPLDHTMLELSKITLIPCAGCITNMKRQLSTLCLAALNWPKQDASIDMAKQQHTYIGRCARVIISKHQKNGMTTPWKQ